ncbi:MAG: hypothetical protein Q8O30_09325, partial [Candidatus Omnitrophota bacterium]|nr:hypothetical protein [Candidatus Omnitrophota bacterium]
MVNGKKIILTAALMAAVCFSLAPVLSLGKTLEIDAKRAAQIQSGLNTMKMAANFMLTNSQIKQVLNTGIGIAKAGTNITYGLVVLSAMSEFDLIDMISSQGYKTQAREYFNSILDERLDLKNYFTGIGFDLPSVVMGVVNGPMTALTLHSFAVTDKTIAIFSTLNVIRQEKLYDGIWRYFDSRRGGESHLVAFEDAKTEMGLMVNINLKWSLAAKNNKTQNDNQLALHFADLWSKWGKYTNSAGITSEARNKFDSEIGEIIVQAAQKQNFALAKPSLWQKVKSFFSGVFGGIADTFADIRKGLEDMLAKLKSKQISQVLTAQMPLYEEESGQSSPSPTAN